jgi:hypothetical protein
MLEPAETRHHQSHQRLHAWGTEQPYTKVTASLASRAGLLRWPAVKPAAGADFLLRAIGARRVLRDAFWGHHTGWGETGAGGRYPRSLAHRIDTDYLAAETLTSATTGK